ncbi:Alpha/Beta hydrolase protein [Panaeolus papilionaceus]|nr:Alpha/Beta hydrolase protein [Panaeolus papilionaceus]
MSNVHGTEETFTIAVPDLSLQTLQQKLALVAFPDELTDATWDYGVPLADIKRLVARWKDGYDWRAAEKELNEELPQFKRVISVDGHGELGIHYVHQKSTVKNAIPLLFVHGWPGSFIEVRKILPLLIAASPDGSFPSFHVVAPSLPGFGFSDAPTRSGFGAEQYAETCHKLMLSLGYDEYVMQGGDWGWLITRYIGCLYGHEHAKAWHTNFSRPEQFNFPPTLKSSPYIYLTSLLTPYSEAEKEGLKRTEWFLGKGFGYNSLQSTKPQTIGYSLADSPVGLLAWIYEKLVEWSDGYKWEDDEVLTWISIYLFSTAGPAASSRIYYEAVNQKRNLPPPTIPKGQSLFPKEILVVPKAWLWSPHLVFTSEHKEGGHFAAHEKPDALVADLRTMFGRGGACGGIVKGREGY